MVLVEYLRQILGAAPQGFDVLEYVFAGCGFLFLLDCTFGFFHALIDWVGNH